MTAVIKYKTHFRKIDRLSRFCTCKNDILHIRTSERFCTHFTDNPTNSVGNITFSAAVRTYDRR